MPTITVTRRHDSAGIFRKMLILVDGIKCAGLRPGRTAHLEVSDGKHVVIAKMGWVTSEIIGAELVGGQSISLDVTLPWSVVTTDLLRPRGAIKLARHQG